MYKAVNLIKEDGASIAAVSASPNDNNGSFVSKRIKNEFEDFLASYKKILLGDGAGNKFWGRRSQVHIKKRHRQGSQLAGSIQRQGHTHISIVARRIHKASLVYG